MLMWHRGSVVTPRGRGRRGHTGTGEGREQMGK